MLRTEIMFENLIGDIKMVVKLGIAKLGNIVSGLMTDLLPR